MIGLFLEINFIPIYFQFEIFRMSTRPELVVVHPLVLLSVVDHYKRVVAKNKNKRVAGVILGLLEVRSS